VEGRGMYERRERGRVPRRRPRTSEPLLTRRSFLLLAASGAVGVAWQAGALGSVRQLLAGPAAAAPAPDLAAAEPTATPTPPATEAPALVAAPAASGSEAAAQSAVLPPLPPRESGFVTRTLPPSRLVIPSIELDAKVLPLGTTRDRTGKLVWETVPFAVGHHQGTANPGEPGNMVLSGHISSPNEGAIFKRLPQVKAGDAVVVMTAQEPYLYRVRDTQVVTPAAVEVLQPTAEAILTLLTCVPDGIYSHRLVVRAEAI
ncbi:MAG TPA: sortase, partial [Chloroflexota bacterium]|nr:sortase [Chloroflexota bacterium]